MVKDYDETAVEIEARNAALQTAIARMKKLRDEELYQERICGYDISCIPKPVLPDSAPEFLRHAHWQNIHAWTARLLQSQIDDLESELHGCLPWVKGRCPRCRARLTPSTSDDLAGKYQHELCEYCQRESL